MKLDWLAASGLDRLPEFLTALAIGLLIGLERERKQTAKGGLRTFAVIALSGAGAAVLADTLSAPSIVAVGLAAVAFMMIAAYYHHHEDWHDQDPGTTTIAAAMACYLLGAMALSGWLQLSVTLSIVMTALLYFKAELGGFARNLENRDLISMLQFAVVAFVVLPVLPDRDFGPYAALNARHVWQMVVLISGISLAGYVALRIFGRERGAVLLGLLGGLVSSTATTLTYARYARRDSAFIDLSVKVIITANIVVIVRLVVLAAIVAPAVLGVLAPVMGVALAAGIAVYAITRRLGAEQSGELTIPDISNPTELRQALTFALLYAGVLMIAAWLADVAGSKGVYVVSLVSGMTDVDAITLSSLRLFDLGTLTASQVAISMVLAISANAAFKLGIVFFAGSGVLLRRCLPVMVAVAAGAGLGLAIVT